MENSRLEGTPEDHLFEPSVEGLASNEVTQGPVKRSLENIQWGRFYHFFGETYFNVYSFSWWKSFFKNIKTEFPVK